MIGVRLDCSARLCDNVPNVFYCDDKLYAGVTLLRNEAVFKPDDSACAKKRERVRLILSREKQWVQLTA